MVTHLHKLEYRSAVELTYPDFGKVLLIAGINQTSE